ncbi:hypothetical protein LJR034_008165 [Caballeronia sp. LjRoot34]|uniref:hypothetical protein n=1 Tax=Caballeronia sp. LjRoot34 TaxID=3342325 RepID=UPI003ECC78A4
METTIYNKEQLLIDLRTFVVIFRALLYSTLFTLSGAKEIGLPLERMDVNAKRRGDDCIIRGDEFTHLLADADGTERLINGCTTFARANLVIAFHERIKGYCRHSTKKNEHLFHEKEGSDRAALHVLKCLRDSATHWTPDKTVDYKSWYGDAIEAREIKIARGMTESDLSFSNAKLIALLDDVQQWVIDNLE